MLDSGSHRARGLATVAPRRRMDLGRTGSAVLGIGVVIAAVAAWQIVATLASSVFFPPPSRIADAFSTLFFSADAGVFRLTTAITVDTAATLGRMLAGFALGSGIGILAGAIIGRSRASRELSDPVVEFLRAVPATATLPLFIILLGGDDGMRIAFIAYGVVWFVLINTALGVSSIHPTLIDMGRIFRQPRYVVLLRIVLPAASPKIFAGLRIGLTAALLLAVVSEFMVAVNGIGYQLVQAQQSFNIPAMWAWMVLLAVVGYLMNTVLEAIERRMLRWDRLARS